MQIKMCKCNGISIYIYMAWIAGLLLDNKPPREFGPLTRASVRARSQILGGWGRYTPPPPKIENQKNGGGG